MPSTYLLLAGASGKKQANCKAVVEFVDSEVRNDSCDMALGDSVAAFGKMSIVWASPAVKVSGVAGGEGGKGAFQDMMSGGEVDDAEKPSADDV